MAYRTINEDLKSHLSKLASWLIEEVQGAGGDGDGLWYSKNYSVSDIHTIVEPLLPEFWKVNWSIDTVYYGCGEEYLTITNSSEEYENAPYYQQVLIKY